MIVGEYTANVSVRAIPMVLAQLNDGNLRVTVNVSGVTQEGSHTLAFKVDPPAGISQSQVVIETGVNGNVITVEVAKFGRREVPVEGVFTGSAAEGYLAGGSSDFLFSPATVYVSGQQELVNQVASARVTISDEGLTETVNGEYPFQLIGASGDPLPAELDVTCDVDTVYVTFPIQATASIPLKVTLNSGGGVSAQDVECELSTTDITVAGSKEDVDAIKAAGAINLATLDLATIRDGDVLTFTVPLADELVNISGETEVTVTVSMKKTLATRIVDTTNIECIDLPDGWNCEFITQVLPVEIRGSEELVSQITGDNLLAVADLKDFDQAGRYTVPVTVYLHHSASSAEVGVMQPADYRIVVNLHQGAAPEPEG